MDGRDRLSPCRSLRPWPGVSRETEAPGGRPSSIGQHLHVRLIWCALATMAFLHQGSGHRPPSFGRINRRVIAGMSLKSQLKSPASLGPRAMQSAIRHSFHAIELQQLCLVRTGSLNSSPCVELHIFLALRSRWTSSCVGSGFAESPDFQLYRRTNACYVKLSFMSSSNPETQNPTHGIVQPRFLVPTRANQ